MCVCAPPPVWGEDRVKGKARARQGKGRGRERGEREGKPDRAIPHAHGTGIMVLPFCFPSPFSVRGPSLLLDVKCNNVPPLAYFACSCYIPLSCQLYILIIV